MGDSYVYMDAHQLRDLCNKVVETIRRCVEHDTTEFLNNEVMAENAHRAHWWARLFGYKPIDAAWMREFYENRSSFYDSLQWHSVTNKWSATIEICNRLLATTHYSHNVHVSSLDLDYLHPWVK